MPTLFAIDNENFVVQSSSNASLIGNGVINNSDTPNGTVFTYTSGGGTTIEINDTAGQPDRFEDDARAGHVIVDGGGIVANGTQVEAESLIRVRALDSGGNPTGPLITITVFSQNGVTSNVWGFSTNIPLENGVSYTKISGSNTGSTTYNTFITCFGSGTQIETAQGPRAVEDIARGAQIWTRDHGLKRVTWTGAAEVEAQGALAPVVFAPGSFGNSRELVVSQQHRMLVSGFQVELLFGTTDVLVAAKHLCGLPGVALRPGGRLRYYHIMFDQHEIIRANGILSESFFVSPVSLGGLDRAARKEFLTLFPQMSGPDLRFGPTAAPALKPHEAHVALHHIYGQNFDRSLGRDLVRNFHKGATGGAGAEHRAGH